MFVSSLILSKYFIVNKPKLVGITGGIGSGKTTVCKIFESLGVPVYYADDLAKQLMENDENLIKTIQSIFGEQSYTNGQLNRPFIADKAFTDKKLLNELNNAVHPVVKADFENWVLENSTQQVLLKEAALLIETGSYKALDALILVVADEQLRIDRVVQRDAHRTPEDVRKIMSEQLPDEEKSRLADFIIRNDSSESLIHQVSNIHSQLVIT